MTPLFGSRVCPNQCWTVRLVGSGLAPPAVDVMACSCASLIGCGATLGVPELPEAAEVTNAAVTRTAARSRPNLWWCIRASFLALPQSCDKEGRKAVDRIPGRRQPNLKSRYPKLPSTQREELLTD